MNLPYSPLHSQAWLTRYLKNNYYKKKYDRFMWWRSYTLKNAPLTIRHSLRDRILNGDFDLGSFIYEIELVEHRINEKYISIGHDDVQYIEAVTLDRARLKRLKDDRDKDEVRKLEDLKKAFLIEFKISKDEYDKEVIKPHKDLISFYYKMEGKYGKYWRPAKVLKGTRLAS